MLYNYKRIADVKEKYLQSYIALGSEPGLYENITKSASDEIDMKDAVFLVYNMLNLEIPLIKMHI